MKLLSSISNNKFTWFSLIFLFIFDNIFSYYAVTQLNGKEANLIIAYWVETYPFLYFLCIPIQIILMYLIITGIVKFTKYLIKRFSMSKENILESILLKSMLIYWLIANSSMNFAFLIGHRLSIPIWYLLTIIGVCCAIFYYFVMIYKTNASQK